MRRAALLVIACLSASTFAAPLERVRGPLGLSAPEFEAFMPVGAKGEALALELPAGLALISAWGGLSDGRLYSVTSSDYPPTGPEAMNPDALLRAVMGTLVRQLGLVDAYEKPIKLGAAKGYAVKANSPRGPVGARFYFVSGRLIALLVIGEPDANTRRFLNGLKLLGAQRSLGVSGDRSAMK